jgi:hypothetical protein
MRRSSRDATSAIARRSVALGHTWLSSEKKTRVVGLMRTGSSYAAIFAMALARRLIALPGKGTEA